MSIPEEEARPSPSPWTVTGSRRSGGSIIILNVEDPYGVEHVIAVDRRVGLHILDAFYAGDVVLIPPPEPWQIISLPAAEDDDYDRCRAAGVHVCPPTDSCDGA